MNVGKKINKRGAVTGGGKGDSEVNSEVMQTKEIVMQTKEIVVQTKEIVMQTHEIVM